MRLLISLVLIALVASAILAKPSENSTATHMLPSEPLDFSLSGAIPLRDQCPQGKMMIRGKCVRVPLLKKLIYIDKHNIPHQNYNYFQTVSEKYISRLSPHNCKFTKRSIRASISQCTKCFGNFSN